MGETRLWYSLFLPLMGLIVYSRWNYKWLLSFSTVLATVFVTINLLKPEIHSKTMMPALQSPRFAPHVIIYMIAYALLGAAFVMAVYLLFFHHHEAPSDKEWTITDNLVYVGLAFLTLGMLSGALWAKMAWGNYWAWDPKETWAAATWLAYLVYIHYRLRRQSNMRFALWVLIVYIGANALLALTGISLSLVIPLGCSVALALFGFLSLYLHFKKFALLSDR